MQTFKGLEVVVAAELSQDAVMCKEIRDKEDIHGNNQKVFNLPSRLIAKIFKFRLIYGGSAYSYANDPDFASVGYNERKWQGVIDAYYDKYKGLRKWHNSLLETVRKNNGVLTIPSGRFFKYEPKKNWRGELSWPLTTIKNYPVQGFGADLVMLARIEFFKRFIASGLEGRFIQTVHDSLVVDTPSKNVYTICTMLRDSVEAVPELCALHFGYNFSLPIVCEIQVGQNKKDLIDFNF